MTNKVNEFAAELDTIMQGNDSWIDIVECAVGIIADRVWTQQSPHIVSCEVNEYDQISITFADGRTAHRFANLCDIEPRDRKMIYKFMNNGYLKRYVDAEVNVRMTKLSK